MELKFAKACKTFSYNLGSNRTFMELKCSQLHILRDSDVSSNRTFMELK